MSKGEKRHKADAVSPGRANVGDLVDEIVKADRLETLENLLDAGHARIELLELIQDVALYVIDRHKLYREDDCRSLSEFVRKRSELFSEGKSSISEQRRIGEAFVSGRCLLDILGIAETDLPNNLSKLPLLSQALESHSQEIVKDVFLHGTVSEFRSLIERTPLRVSGSASLPPTLSIQKFHAEIVRRSEASDADEHASIIDRAYTLSEDRQVFVLDKGLSRKERDELVDVLYAIGFKNPKLHDLDQWMLGSDAYPGEISIAPIKDRSSRMLFPLDHPVPRAETRSALLDEVRRSL